MPRSYVRCVAEILTLAFELSESMLDTARHSVRPRIPPIPPIPPLFQRGTRRLLTNDALWTEVRSSWRNLFFALDLELSLVAELNIHTSPYIVEGAVQPRQWGVSR